MSINNENPQNTIDAAIPALEDLRLSQDYASIVEVEEVPAEVRVGRPDAQTFFQVHPDEAWRIQTMVLEIRAERASYLVAQELWPELEDELKAKLLYTCATPLGSTFIWPVRLPGPDGGLDSWSQSAHEAAKLATGAWVRLIPHGPSSSYRTRVARGDLGEPQWPEGNLHDLLRRAFAERFIRSLDHPVIRQLWGQV